MLIFMETVNLIAILLMLFMLAVILRQKPSKAQTAFILYNVFTILFVIGIHLELLHSDTVGEAVAGLSVQYLGQAGFLMSLLWFVSEFANFSYVQPLTATGFGFPISHIERSIICTPRSISGPPPDCSFVVNQPPLPGIPRRLCQPQRAAYISPILPSFI